MDRVTFLKECHTDQAGVRSHHPELASNGTTNPTNRNETIENKAIKRLGGIKLRQLWPGYIYHLRKLKPPITTISDRTKTTTTTTKRRREQGIRTSSKRAPAAPAPGSVSMNCSSKNWRFIFQSNAQIYLLAAR